MTQRQPLSRRQQMSRIKARNTSPEQILRKALWREGLRYRLHGKTEFGRPDLVFPGKRVALFVDGCFWHGCPIHYVRPRSREAFWAGKLHENVERDCFQTRALEAAGWRVLRFWEHDIFTNIAQVITAVQNLLQKDELDPAVNWRVFKVSSHEEEGMEHRYMLDLRDSNKLKLVKGKRITTKWRAPRA